MEAITLKEVLYGIASGGRIDLKYQHLVDEGIRRGLIEMVPSLTEAGIKLVNGDGYGSKDAH